VEAYQNAIFKMGSCPLRRTQGGMLTTHHPPPYSARQVASHPRWPPRLGCTRLRRRIDSQTGEEQMVMLTMQVRFKVPKAFAAMTLTLDTSAIIALVVCYLRMFHEKLFRL
jgi:hypothetical protein